MAFDLAWTTTRLGTVAIKIRSGATPKGGTENYLDTRERYALVRSQNVFDHHFDETGLAFISDKQAQDLAGAELQEKDVLLNITGDGTTFGRCCLVPKHILPACVNQHVVLIRTNSQQCCPEFLASWLALPPVKTYVESFNSGGSRRAITKGNIESFEVPLPPIETQRKIGYIAANINDRIDNLHRTNTTLEAIAAALFKSWFVDFDGVSAEDMRESELGLIPKGWRAFTFGEIATLGKGSVNPAVHPQTIFQHYSLPAFDAGQMPIAETGEAIKSNKTSVPFGAVLVSKLNPHIPRIWFVGDPGENAVCSTEFLVWTPKPGIGSAFVYFVATSSEFNASIRQLVTGTSNSHQRVKPDQLANTHAAIADSESIAAFDEAATPLLKKIEHNRRQAATLAVLRDSLLPRLISGQLRVTQ